MVFENLYPAQRLQPPIPLRILAVSRNLGAETLNLGA
jgi:hypothetical protein